ncbi:hypothetical protein CRG98_048001 [Punica granatum]|uniref:Uncharacterized protein n=1 Tax=Punica granatum TaxID=22663 RepID=A0A2I0HIT9_PUNGR|nr:hypothetical protein CRG98_048001 [Punica granatum]
MVVRIMIQIVKSLGVTDSDCRGLQSGGYVLGSRGYSELRPGAGQTSPALLADKDIVTAAILRKWNLPIHDSNRDSRFYDPRPILDRIAILTTL